MYLHIFWSSSYLYYLTCMICTCIFIICLYYKKKKTDQAKKYTYQSNQNWIWPKSLNSFLIIFFLTIYWQGIQKNMWVFSILCGNLPSSDIAAGRSSKLSTQWEGTWLLWAGIFKATDSVKVPELEERQGRNTYLLRSEYLSTTMLPWTTPSSYKKKLLTLYGPMTSLKFRASFVKRRKSRNSDHPVLDPLLT